MADDWRELNRANWDERVAVHLGASGYDLAPLRAGRGRLNAIEEAELGPFGGLRVLHLQCHFGRDSLVLAGRGAEVTGLDFSGPAVLAARSLAAELGLAARFVQADLYDAPAVVSEPASFDLVYTTWGTITWLRPCCMDQWEGCTHPNPVLGSCDADGLRASQLQHAVEGVDGNVHLGRPTLVRARAQPVADHAFEPAHGGLGPGADVVPGRFLPSHAARLGDRL